MNCNGDGGRADGDGGRGDVCIDFHLFHGPAPQRSPSVRIIVIVIVIVIVIILVIVNIQKRSALR